jgi:hypothetical protein
VATWLERQRDAAVVGGDCLTPSQDMNASATGRIVGRHAETTAADVSICDQVVGVLIVSVGKGRLESDLMRTDLASKIKVAYRRGYSGRVEEE